MNVLRSLAFYLVFYSATAGFVLAAVVMIPLHAGAFRRVVHCWSAWHRGCARILLGIGVQVRGEMPARDVIVAMKHESFFEAIDLPNTLERPAIFAKVELLRIPLWGRAAAAYGVVAVERDQGAKALRSMIAQARALRDEGRPLAIFPEGTRIPHGSRRSLQSGFAGLYKLLGLPVVPVAVDSGRLYHRLWKRSGTITYLVGETIEPGLPREEIEARVLIAINALNEG